MSDKKVRCKNRNNQEVVFDFEFNPFFLVSIEGAYSVNNSVNTTENTMTDGSTFQGATGEQRNIVITAQMDSNYDDNRDYLYKTFKRKSSGTLTHYQNGKTRLIDYWVESVDIDDAGVVRNIVISLICPDPMFRAPYEVVLEMAAWEDLLEWPHEFLEEGEEFGRWISEQSKEAPNESEVEGVGLTITFTANGAVENPAIYHSEDNEFIKLNRTLQAGEIVIITTHDNDKHTYLMAGGEREDINYDLDDESEFIQLNSDKNTLIYSADSGAEYLEVEVRYLYLFEGA